MKKTLELAWGVIRRPAPTFRRIKEEKPLRSGIIICLTALIFKTLLLYLLIPEAFLKKVEGITEYELSFLATGFSRSIGESASLIILMIVIYCFVRILKGQPNFKALFISFLCVTVLDFIGSPLLLGASYFNSEIGYKVIRRGMYFWSAILGLVAIRKIFNFSILRTITAYVIPLFSTGLFLLGLGVLWFVKAFTIKETFNVFIISLVSLSGIALIIAIVLTRRERLKRKILFALQLITFSIVLGMALVISLYMFLPAWFMNCYPIYPWGIACDSKGNVYVESPGGWGGRTIFKFDPEGKRLLAFRGDFGVGPDIDINDNIYLANGEEDGLKRYNSQGILQEEIYLGTKEISDFAVNTKGDFYILDSKKDIITKFNQKRKKITDLNYSLLPILHHIVIDHESNIYVEHLKNNKKRPRRVTKFDSQGNVLLTIGGEFKEFGAPWSMAVDNRGNLYILIISSREKYPKKEYKVEKFDSQGRLLLSFGEIGYEEGKFLEPPKIAVDSSGNIYTTDSWLHRIQKFNSEGKHVLTITPNILVKKIMDLSFWGQLQRPNPKYIESLGLRKQ